MRKSDLRKLRKLNATKEMMEKAAENEELTEVKDSYGYKRKYKRKYGMFMRCQNLGGILKVALFYPDEMRCGTETPKYEIFLNYKGSEYITRELDRNGIELKWRTARIDNLDFLEKGSNWSYFYDSRKKAWINPEGSKQIKNLLNVEKGGYEGIRKYQERISDEKIKEQRRKETAPWDADMALIPKLPTGFEKWWKKEAITENFIFYDYKRGGAKTGYCSYCEKEVPIQHPKHSKTGECPCCKKKITYKVMGKIKRLGTKAEHCQIIQEIPEGFVVRYFGVSKSYRDSDYKKPLYHIWEKRRTLYRENCTDTYLYELYKNSITRWCKQEKTYHYWCGSGMVYKRNIGLLEKTVLKHSSLPIIVRENRKINVERWLEKEKGNPTIEKLVRIGMLTMAFDMSECGYDHRLLQEDESELAKILKIDKSRLSRLKNMDGNIDHLRWMQLEKKKNTIYPDEMIKYFAENKVEPGELKFISDRMTYVQIFNYIKKQREGVEESMYGILTTWKDYLNMAKKAKMPVENEMVYKPKNLKEKHSEMIFILEQENIKEMANKRLEQYPQVNDVCKTLEKYEYTESGYTIVAPKSIEDIIKEGIALQHCIHTCDFYFDRMNKQESYILFLRKTETVSVPYYTLEVEPSGNIRQKRTTGDNQNKDFDEAIGFLQKWQKEINKRLSKEDRKLGERSNEKRKKEYEKLRKDGNRIWHGRLAGKLLVDVLEEDFMEV